MVLVVLLELLLAVARPPHLHLVPASASLHSASNSPRATALGLRVGLGSVGPIQTLSLTIDRRLGLNDAARSSHSRN